jgi:hypothetical protein
MCCVFSQLKKTAKGEYTFPDPSNAACMEDLQVVSEVSGINHNYPVTMSKILVTTDLF